MAFSCLRRWWCHRAFLVCLCWLAAQLFRPLDGAGNLLTSFEVQHGYIYPPAVTVAEGEVMHLRLLVPMQEGDRCLYREPGSPTDIDVHGGDNDSTRRRTNKLLRFGDAECSIRVNPVHRRDGGFWRLTLVRGTERIRGVTMVDVIERPAVPEIGAGGSASVSSFDEISPQRTEYCFVQRQSSMEGGGDGVVVPMYERCHLPLSETDPTGAGVWSVIAGVQGQMREMSYGIQIENKGEQIVTAVDKELDYHVLSCTLRYTKLTLKFCRFVRLADGLGLNVVPGIGTPRYGYIGAGFERNECGLEILGPEGLDKGTWKCLLGYGDEALTKVSGAIVDNSDTSPPLAIVGRDVTAIAQNGTTASLLCNANKPIDHCWFRGPHGQFYSLSESLTHGDGAPYWYSGIALSMGECGITFATLVDGEHAGRWHCYVGNGHVSALEVSASFEVRISPSQIISPAGDRVEAVLGFPALLGCDSIPRGTPLQYCRFVTPAGEAFSLNENVTTERPVLGRFYSNPNHNLAKGSCSLVIAAVREEDFGQWICAGKIEGHPVEHIYGVSLHNRDDGGASGGEDEDPTATGDGTLSAASISGMVVGAVAVVGGAVAIGYWQFRKRLHRQTVAANEEIQMRTMEERPRISVLSTSISEGSSSSNTNSQTAL